MVTDQQAAIAAEDWLTPQQIGPLYNKSADSVWYALRHGIQTPAGRLRLKGRKVGDSWQTTRAFMDEFIAECTRRSMGEGAAPVMEPQGARQRKARAEQERARKALGGKA